MAAAAAAAVLAAPCRRALRRSAGRVPTACFASNTLTPLGGPPPVVRLLGDPVLHAPCADVADVRAPAVAAVRAQLHAALQAFRAAHGYGRGMSAPQIGAPLRMIALNLGRGRILTLHNPRLAPLPGAASVTLWDDCMSIPDMMVRVRRAAAVHVTYTDDEGRPAVLHDAATSPSLAELLQHECDHLDGVTAVDRAEAPPGGGPAIMHRAVYTARRADFDARVDMAIVPTV